MAKADPQVVVRMSAETKEWLTRLAEQNFRSVNAEVLLAIKEKRDRVEDSGSQ